MREQDKATGNAAGGGQDAAFEEMIARRKRFFAQPAPPGYAEEWAAVLAAIPPAKSHAISVLEFRIANLELAVSLHWVKAVTDRLALCPVPHRDNTAFLGLVAFGGDVIPCCSLARILGAADSIQSGDARTIVLEERPGERWAFPVDAVLGVSRRSMETEHETDKAKGTTQLAAEWRELAYQDDRNVTIEMLRPETLFQRFGRAIA